MANVRRTGPATAGMGGYANTGLHLGDVYVTAPEVARSAYLEQVKRIAPDELVGRESELADLAAFCTANSGCGYVWWQAPAWAGKSALMSWFVLHPPAGVRVASFFITARYAGNSDRNALVDVMLEQLAEIAEQPLRQPLAQGTRELWLLKVLKEAALACAALGQRLALVVDGLDEDRGVTVGPEAYSIAALLPSRLPEGVRVIVAGRPNPPIPADVMDGHPLRTPDVVRQLAPSEHAQVIRNDALRELKQLLYGTPAEQDLLGLVAAAGGGLSGPDLAELTDLPVAVIDDHLRTVSGRTFSIRASRWAPDTHPVVYLLAHEELQISAMRYLGEIRLNDYRHRLHIWNDHYRERGWPIETPEYLLRGYFRMISSIRDLSRMIACTTDQLRLDRMLDISKGDVTAFTDIITTQNIICEQPRPDLSAMLALAITRDRLISRNNNIPYQIPAVWARLGNLPRAEALVHSITRGSHKDKALVLLVVAVAATGDYVRAEEFVDAITEPIEQVKALARLVETSANEDYDRAIRLAERAEKVAFSISRIDLRARALVLLVEAVAAIGDYDRAERLVRTITEPVEQAEALAELVEIIAADADPDRATRLAEQAETISRNPAEPTAEAESLTFLMRTAAAVGDQAEAIRLAEQAEAIALTITDPNDQAWALIGLVTVTARIGAHDLAVRLVEQAATAIDPINDWFMHMQALAGLIEVTAAAGYRELAEELTHATVDADSLAWAMASLANGAAESGDYNRAETIAYAITVSSQKAETLASLVNMISVAGNYGRAETIAYTITSPAEKAKAIASLAERLAEAAYNDRAIRLAEEAEMISRTVNDQEAQARELALLAEAVASIGERDAAIQLSEKVEAIFRSAEPEIQMWVLNWWVIALAATGDFDKAEEESLNATTPLEKTRALIPLIKMVAAVGEYDRAEKIVRTIAATDKDSLPQALMLLVKAAATIGNYDRAERLAHTIIEPAEQAEALARLMEMAADKDHDRATRLAEQLETIIRNPAEPTAEAESLTFLMRTAAAVGDQDKAIRLAEQAETIALTITNPNNRVRKLTDLVRAMANTGLLTQAEAIADAMINSNADALVLSKQQPEAFVAIARCAGEMKRVQLVALALREGDWTISLDLLAAIDPSLLLTIVNQFL